MIEAAQPISGVTPDEAQSEAFQQAFVAAVAEKLDVDESQVSRALLLRPSPHSLSRKSMWTNRRCAEPSLYAPPSTLSPLPTLRI